MEDYKPKKTKRVISNEEDGSILIFDSGSGSIHTLNETGALIWNNIDGTTSVRDIVTRVLKENPDEEREDVEEEVIKFLKELKKLNFIEE